jgi:hypothetical protein
VRPVRGVVAHPAGGGRLAAASGAEITGVGGGGLGGSRRLPRGSGSARGAPPATGTVVVVPAPEPADD